MSDSAEGPTTGKTPAASHTAGGLPKRVPFSGPHPGDLGRGAVQTSPSPPAPALTAPPTAPAGEKPHRSIPTIPHPRRAAVDLSDRSAPRQADPPAGTAPAAGPRRRRARRAWLLPAGLAVAVLVAGSAWWHDHDSTAPPPSRAGAVTDQTTAAAVGQGATPEGLPDSAASSGRAAGDPRPSATTSAPSKAATTRPTPAASVNAAGRDLALHRPAWASGSQGAPWAPANAVDGDAETRWSSAFSDPQWLVVDLGARWQISRILIQWEHAYGTAYRLEVSTDARTWRQVFSTTQGRGGNVTVTTDGAIGRYVRLYGTRRSTQYGYSIYELDVR